MSDSAGEKTEEPTTKKLSDARKKGQISQSQDVNKLFVTIAGFQLLLAMYDSYYFDITQFIATTYTLINYDLSYAGPILAREAIKVWLAIILPFLSVVILARYIASLVQYGFLIAPESFKLDMSKFSPVKNGKNIFSKKKFLELLGNIVKAVVLASVVWHVVKINLPQILMLSLTDIHVSLEFSISVFRSILNMVLFTFLVISVADYIMQKKIFIKGMKMTKDEVFREYKQMEGDPQVKGQRKQFAHQLVFGDAKPIKKKVSESDAVVVNPTHYAVAIEYKPGKTPLPIMRAKGVDDRAAQIIKIAKENNVPVIRYVSLARHVFRTGKEDKYIPADCLQQMAAVFIAIKQAEEADKGEDYEYEEIKDSY